jgi:hypothetical protein
MTDRIAEASLGQPRSNSFRGGDPVEAGRRGGLAQAANREARLLRQRVEELEHGIAQLERDIAAGAPGNNAARAIVLRSKVMEHERLTRELAAATSRANTPNVELVKADFAALTPAEKREVLEADGIEVSA